MRTTRLPSVRSPRTFYDVFGVAVITIAVLTAVTAVRSGALVGYEVVAVLLGLSFWTVWAVRRILERAAPDGEAWPP